MGIPAEDFIATDPSERHFEPPRRHFFGDDIRVDRVHRWRVHFHNRLLNCLDDLRGGKANFRVIRLVSMGDHPGELTFVVGGIFKAHRESVELAVEGAGGEGGDHRGIDSPTEKAGHGDIGKNVFFHGGLEEFAGPADDRGAIIGRLKVGKMPGRPVSDRGRGGMARL